jgi:hypothetical protein
MGVTGAIEPADDDMMVEPLNALCCGDDPVFRPVEKPRWTLKEHCCPPAMLEVDVMMTGLMAVETRPILLLLLLADVDDMDELADSSSVKMQHQHEFNMATRTIIHPIYIVILFIAF